MGTIMSCESTMSNIDDTSENFSPLPSSPNDNQIELFHCGCCTTATMADDLDGCSSQQNEMMGSHEMEARNAAKLLFPGTSEDLESDFLSIDVTIVHPSSPPFLGTSYWISMEIDCEDGDVAPLLNVSQDSGGILIDDDGDDGNAIDQSILTMESINTSVESSAIHTSCITASSRELTGPPSSPTSDCSSQHQPSRSSPNYILQNTSCTVSTPCHTPQQLQTQIRPQQEQQQQQQPSLETSSVSTDTTVSCTSPTVLANVETARRLFGIRDDMLYNQDNNFHRDQVTICPYDDSSHDDDDHYNNILNVTNSSSLSPNTSTSTSINVTNASSLSPDISTSTSTSTENTNSTISCNDIRYQQDAGACSPQSPDSQDSSLYSPKSEVDSTSNIILRNGVLLRRPPSPSPNLTPITVSPTSTTSSNNNTTTSNTTNTTTTTYSTNTAPDTTSFLTDTVDIPDGVFGRDEYGMTRHVNTLPSFHEGNPIRLRVTESYAGYSSGGLQQTACGDGLNYDGGDSNHNNNSSNHNNSDSLNASGISLLSNEEQQHFFSYDPYFSSGKYLIEQTDTGDCYGNKIHVLMGEQYMTLQDGDGTVWAVTRSRHTLCPSTVIYSPKERYPGQIPSSHRPTSQQRCGDYLNLDAGEDAGVELYPWALVKKEGKEMDHDVAIHLVAELGRGSSGGNIGGGVGVNRQELIGGLFDSRVSFRSRHGFDAKEAHSYTIMCRVEMEEEKEEGSTVEGKNEVEKQKKEIPCCIILRDSINRDIADVTIAPGIDPLLIICYLAVHAKMQN